ncbi:hypothetical protein ACIBSW_06815 [Actinoplanes sp. NPDC049668]|uniref:hypothetical protein n=1 Tax=unclassified Actinoplanes TaxID=2626549 RepID=UPI0033BD20F6
MDYDLIAEALAAAARTCTYDDPDGNPTLALNAHGFARDEIDPPTFEVGEVEIGDDETFDDDFGSALESPQYTCRLYVSRASDGDLAHPLLRRFLRPSGPGSVKAALEADRTLGGLVDALVVAKRFGYGVYDVGGVDYLGARFTVRVWGRG